MREWIDLKRKRIETVEEEAGKGNCAVYASIWTNYFDFSRNILYQIILYFSDNCSSGQSSQACTPNGDGNLDGSSGVGSDVAPLSFQSSHGSGLKNINENSSYEQSTKLSPTKTLIQKFNNIGLETGGNNNQSDRQKQYR